MSLKSTGYEIIIPTKMNYRSTISTIVTSCYNAKVRAGSLVWALVRGIERTLAIN